MWKLVNRLWTIMGAFFVLLLMLFGLILIFQGLGELDLARAPVTPLSELGQHADNGERVRVLGKPVGSPLTTPAGGRFALVKLEVGHSVGSANRSSWTVDYRGQIPARLRISDGQSEAIVDTTGAEERFLRQLAPGAGATSAGPCRRT